MDNPSFYCRSPETNKSWRVDGNTGGITARFFKRVSFKTHFYNGDYWVGLLESPEYKKITLKAFRELVLMPTTYMSEKDFSCLVKLKTKERNTLKYVCLLMRGTLEELIQPQFEKVITEIQEHPNH